MLANLTDLGYAYSNCGGTEEHLIVSCKQEMVWCVLANGRTSCLESSACGTVAHVRVNVGLLKLIWMQAKVHHTGSPCCLHICFENFAMMVQPPVITWGNISRWISVFVRQIKSMHGVHRKRDWRVGVSIILQLYFINSMFCKSVMQNEPCPTTAF